MMDPETRQVQSFCCYWERLCQIKWESYLEPVSDIQNMATMNYCFESS